MPYSQNSREGEEAPAADFGPRINDFLNLSPRRFLITAAVVIALLALTSTIAGSLYHTAWEPRFRTVVFYNAFWIDNEGNIPTFFNFSLIMMAAFLITIIARIYFLSRKQWRHHWSAMAIIFFALAFDEAAQVHESTVGFVRYLLGASGIFYFAWIVPAMGLLAVFVLAYLGFLRALPARVSALMVLGGALYVAGAIGMEMIGGAIAEANKMDGIAYGVSSSLEEMLEMFGLSVFITALLRFCREHLS